MKEETLPTAIIFIPFSGANFNLAAAEENRTAFKLEFSSFIVK
jgi:hypothetical protein